jgi:thiol-disulfide isomerase/thioredoxin
MRRSTARLGAAASLLGLVLTARPALAVGYLEPHAEQGSAPPQLALPDLEGTTHRLADYRGKVVLVNFWASWCTPCIEEMPSMQRLARAQGSDRFQILAVNVAEAGPRIERALKTARVDLPVLLDRHSEAFADWEVRVLPTSFLIDPAGAIRYVGLGPIEWDGPEASAIVEELLPPRPEATPGTEPAPASDAP